MSDPSSMPSYPAPDPSTPRARPAAVAIPSQVNIAFWLYLVGAALSLVTLIISLATVGASKTAIQHQLASQGKHISAGTLNTLLVTTVAVAVVIGVIFIAAYVLFAYFMRRGANWARIVLLVLTVLSLIQVTSIPGSVRFLAAAVATVMIFLRPANEYFKAVKAAKLAALGR